MIRKTEQRIRSLRKCFVRLLQRLRNYVRKAFSYGMRHISYALRFNEVWPYASLNRNGLYVSDMKMPHLRDCAISVLCRILSHTWCDRSLLSHKLSGQYRAVMIVYRCPVQQPNRAEPFHTKTVFPSRSRSHIIYITLSILYRVLDLLLNDIPYAVVKLIS